MNTVDLQSTEPLEVRCCLLLLRQQAFVSSPPGLHPILDGSHKSNDILFGIVAMNAYPHSIFALWDCRIGDRSNEVASSLQMTGERSCEERRCEER